MKEQIDTIPVSDAFASDDECPFCYLARKARQSTLRYVAGPGASYMEPDVRAATDAAGFCADHLKDLYDYGNTLGSALMLQSHFAGLLKEWETAEAPSPRSLRKQSAAPWWQRLRRRRTSCFLCDRIAYHMRRYFATFFAMLKDSDFRTKVTQCKGFCVPHFVDLMDHAQTQLPRSQKSWFYDTVPALTRQNLIRVKGDLDWLIAKYDYRNAGEPWHNARDALPRAMQKLQGSHPADPPYKSE